MTQTHKINNVLKDCFYRRIATAFQIYVIITINNCLVGWSSSTLVAVILGNPGPFVCNDHR